MSIILAAKTENFGQNEVRKMLAKCDPYGTQEQRAVHAMVERFNEWAMNGQ